MKLTPAASTRTSTWPGPGFGVGRSASCITSGSPCFSTGMAFMVAFLAARGPDVKRTESLSARPIPRYSAHPPPPRKDAYEDGRPETPRSLRPSPHRPRRLRRREDDRGPRPPLLGRADRPHGPAIDPPAAAARSAAGAVRARAASRDRGDRGQEPGFPLVHRDGLLGLRHAARHPPQHPREPRLVHAVHALPARDPPAPPPAPPQLPN